MVSPFHRPTLLYDGHCGFCVSSAQRLRGLVHPQVQLLDYHPTILEYPGLADPAFARGIRLILPDGSCLVGARALLKALQLAGRYGWAYALYQHIPPVRWIIDGLYSFVATHRHRWGG